MPPDSLQGIHCRVIIATALFVVLAIPIGIWNRELFLVLNGIHSPAADYIMGLVSGLGDGLIVVLAVSCILLWRPRFGMAGIAAFFLSGGIAQILKRTFDLPRPPAVLEQVHVLGAPLRAHSFPSGHATSIALLIPLGFMLFGARDWRAWAICLLCLLAAYGRIYGGVHFPLDVWVGLGLGSVSMVLVWPWVKNMPEQAWERGDWMWRISVMLVIVEAAVLGLGYRIQPATSQPVAWIAAVMALGYVMWMWKHRSGH